MEFGSIEDISNVNWTLPAEDLKRIASTDYTDCFKIFLGSPAWSCKHWVGKIYPKNTPPDSFLSYYSKNFNCIELNTTHYRIPTSSIAREWCEQVERNFLFCPKLHKDISHAKTGLLDLHLLKEWYAFLDVMSSNLGPCFIQFSERFSYENKSYLFRFLETWPSEFRLSIELRHSSWFPNGNVLPALADYLHKKGIGLVITDVAGRRDVLHGTMTTEWALVRLIGLNLHASDQLRLEYWAKQLKNWSTNGVREAYLFLHQPDDIWTIEFAQMAEQVFVNSGLQSVPHFKIQQEVDLFSF